ncbi:uncharacterized protein LY79DRAFT_694443 [Colletotrichum navitas]|uniref:Uncharacterized protein n=1 Tax=Colletotrichum navitas TaxID=681940 RepID=A0AAD8UZG6_9PEZI|nr:uncharacterized protein LY79DRAFT_694443 [Colletotrichum navitas]KAK1579245.1 hypothetical protein LY79DRAFT_694443 [Colletotrichum navitas]
MTVGQGTLYAYSTYFYLQTIPRTGNYLARFRVGGAKVARVAQLEMCLELAWRLRSRRGEVFCFAQLNTSCMSALTTTLVMQLGFLLVSWLAALLVALPARMNYRMHWASRTRATAVCRGIPTGEADRLMMGPRASSWFTAKDHSLSAMVCGYPPPHQDSDWPLLLLNSNGPDQHAKVVSDLDLAARNVRHNQPKMASVAFG